MIIKLFGSKFGILNLQHIDKHANYSNVPDDNVNNLIGGKLFQNSKKPRCLFQYSQT